MIAIKNDIVLYEYLGNLLGVQGRRELVEALQSGQTVLISGPHAPTGKTTLAAVLRKRGYNAVEKEDTYEVFLTKSLPEPYDDYLLEKFD